MTQLNTEVTELVQRVTVIESGQSAIRSRMEVLEIQVDESTREIGSLNAANARSNETIERLTVKIDEVKLGETSQVQPSNNVDWHSPFNHERRSGHVTPPRGREVAVERRGRGTIAGSHAQYRGSITGIWGSNAGPSIQEREPPTDRQAATSHRERAVPPGLPSFQDQGLRGGDYDFQDRGHPAY